MAATVPTDVKSLAEIFKAGDYIIANPAETCIIFVSVIVVSALLEYGILIMNNKVQNKYAKMIIETMTQELTIVGVLALLLMLATSLTPSGDTQDRMSTLFTWANMNLFFMAFFFVCIVIMQFLFSGWTIPRWRQFEESRMDSEELSTLGYPERTYKVAFERFADELFLVFGLSNSECGFSELIEVHMRKTLVKLGNITWPVWLGLLPVIALNGVRAYFTPYDGTSQQGAFLNSLMFMGATGYFTMFVFLAYFGLLQRRVQNILQKRVKRSVRGVDHLPLGSVAAGVWFLQVVLMSLNWYVTLFITGMGRSAFQQTAQWQSAILAFVFFVPLVVVHGLIPWTILCLSIMSIFGSVDASRSSIERIVRRRKGDFDEEDSETTEDEAVAKRNKDGLTDDDEGESPNKSSPPNGVIATGGGGYKAPPMPMPGKKKMPPAGFPPFKKGMPSPPYPGKHMPGKRPMPQGSAAAVSTHTADKYRPNWLEDDEHWGAADEQNETPTNPREGDDGQTIDASSRYDFLYYETMDGKELREMIRKDKSAADILDELDADDELELGDGGAGGGDDDADRHAAYDANKRPAWLDSDEEWP